MPAQMLEMRPLSRATFACTDEALIADVPPQSRGLEPGEQRSYIVPMLSRALHIIEIMKRQRNYITAQQITAITGYSRSSVYRILRTLAAHDYILEDDKGGFLLRKAIKTLERN